MIVTLLIFHGLVAMFLLGALTHQAFTSLRSSRAQPPGGGFVVRYSSVQGSLFRNAVAISYILTFALGAWLYPVYRLDVRPAFEEMYLGWAIGVFEIKEHWAALGLGLLPAYWIAWSDRSTRRGVLISVTWALAVVTWFGLLAGHVLNNIRGL